MATSTATDRVYNFSSGPAVMPVPVLEQIQHDLVSLPGVGMSILEVSHRSKVFEGVIAKAEADLRALASIPSNYKVLFLQGTTADYIITGSWTEKAAKEAKKVGTVHIAASSAADNFCRIPKASETELTQGSAYVHITSNNTIEGTQWHSLPDVGNAPLISDASSDILSRPVDVTAYGLIYAGAQKNLGPSGTTVVIIREDLLARSAKTLHTMLNYAVHAENGSLYNTPPCFPIYAVGLVLQWLKAQGGLAAVAEVNERKAGKLYAEVDRTGFWRPTADKADRSLMNVTFRLSSEELEAKFVKESTAAGFDGLKGHRSVGGMRASIYNAFPEAGIDALVDFMREFERKNG